MVVVVSEVRIALEGQLEKVEAAGELLRRVQALLRSRRVEREDLAQADRALRTITATGPAPRRFSTDPEVVSAFNAAAEAMSAILREGRALCRLLDVPLPCAVNELRAALEPHLPIHLSATLLGTPLENVGVLLIPSLLAVAGFPTPVGTPIAPFLLAAGLFLALSVVHGTKRVVVSATRLRLGARSWALNDISRFVVEGPSMVVATIETHAGTTCEVLLPGAIDPLIVALRSGGVAVSVQFRSEASS